MSNWDNAERLAQETFNEAETAMKKFKEKNVRHAQSYLIRTVMEAEKALAYIHRHRMETEPQYKRHHSKPGYGRARRHSDE